MMRVWMVSIGAVLATTWLCACNEGPPRVRGASEIETSDSKAAADKAPPARAVRRTPADAPSGATELPVLGGLPYRTARARLLAAGFRPVRREGFGTPDDACGGSYLEGCRYEEAETCSGTGLGFCRFYFVRNGQRLRVRTFGDPTPFVDVMEWAS